MAQEEPEFLLNVQKELTAKDSMLEDGSFLDSYSFDMKEGQNIIIQLESEYFNPYWTIFNNEGEKVLEQNDLISFPDMGYFLGGLAPGAYLLKITAADNSIVNGYSVRIKEATEIDKQKNQARILNRLGLAYNNIGEKELALNSFQEALAINRAIEDLKSESDNLNNIGYLYISLGKTQEALDYYQQALSVSEKISDISGVVTTLGNIASVYSLLGEYDKALASYIEVLVKQREIQDISGEVTTLSNIGYLYTSIGENRKALDYYYEALSLNKKIGDNISEGITLNNIGSAYQYLGKYDRAINYFQESLLIKKDHNGEATSLNNIGSVYEILGENQQSLDYYQQALLIIRKTGYRFGEAGSLNNIGSVYSSLGEYEKALDYYLQALLVSREIGSQSTEATSLNNLGLYHYILNDKEKILSYYQEALKINRAINNKLGEATVLNNLGLYYTSLQNYEKAFDYYQQALSLSNSIMYNLGEASSLNNFAYLFFEKGDYQKANQYFYRSLELKELINNKDLDDVLKISFLDTYRNTYKSLQKSLITENKQTEALEIAERGRARALVELLNKRFSGSAEFIPMAKPTIAELKAIAKDHDSTLVTYSLIPSETAPRQFENTELYIYVITPQGDVEFRAVDLTQRPNFSEAIAAARKTVSTPPPERGDRSGAGHTSSYQFTDFQVGDYVKLQGEFPTDEPWQIIALNPNSQTLTLDQTQRETPLENVSPNRIATKTDTSLQQLHQILIDPIADLLPSNPDDDVIFMPQDALFGIPFPALQDANGEYLIEKHTILTSPSIQVLSQTAAQNKRLNSQPKPSNRALVVGNPFPYPKNLNSLENAVTEAQNIGELLGVKPLLGKAATEAKVLEQMSQADILHFATHASFDDQNGIRSAIYLTAEPNAPDDDLFETPGRITAEEIFNQFENNPLNARLAVLSACDTGQGEITGDGVIGLSRSLIAAGVPSVLVSLWSVDDASTSELMTEFYRQWQNNNVDKATALRNAMLQTKAEYPEPYYWSAFTLIGEAE
ncbi:hypothetical protein AWQ21_15505 (plasmid) [Picosynechococcus sp. PCC 7003]|nr:hypothetical protein AWQ21_15505 [Picosynechococcus sp. PCC 7003]